MFLWDFIDENVAAVSLDGIKPTLESVKKGDYKVARGLYSNTKGKAKGLAEKFINYLLGPDGQTMAGEKGFIPVN